MYLPQFRPISFDFSLSLSLQMNLTFPLLSVFFFTLYLSPLHFRDQYNTCVYQAQQGITYVIDFAISRASVRALFRSCTEPYHETVIG